MIYRIIIAMIALPALSWISAWGFPWNLPLVVVGGLCAGMVAERGIR